MRWYAGIQLGVWGCEATGLPKDFRGKCASTFLLGRLGRAFLLLTLFATGLPAAENPILLENQFPGTQEWIIPWGSEATDITGQIKGYASATSVQKGGSINLHISVNPAQTFTIDVFRMGWYQGNGGRLLQQIGPLDGVQQSPPVTDPVTGLIECHWTNTHTLNIPEEWTTGVYLARLKNAQGFQNYITFVVRDDNRVGALLYQQPVTTMQAYNDYPYDNATGKSLYAFNSYGSNTIGGLKAAVKVSFDRPYAGDGDNHIWGRNVLGVEHAFIRWLERSGYDVTYATDIDTHLNSGRLLSTRGLISPGHDEYWTKEMVDGVYAARDAGVNLGFFSANMVYTQIRLESSTIGTSNRVVVCYRNAALDPHPDPAFKTVNWREAPVNRPEQALLGVQFTGIVRQNAQGLHAPYVVTNSSHWVYAGTSFQDGDSVSGLVGYEADKIFGQFPLPDAVPGTYTVLSHSPFLGSLAADFSHSSIYQAPSGAWVFAAGTINWGYGLDPYNTASTNLSDARIQRMTANILERFLGLWETNFFLGASPASKWANPGGSTSFNIAISPTGGFEDSVSLDVTGVPAGATASFSVNPTTNSSTLTINVGPETPLGTHPLLITGNGGGISHTSTVTLDVVLADFALSVAPTNRTVLIGRTTNFTVTISTAGGFAEPVQLGILGLPLDTFALFDPNPALTNSTLSIITSSNTPGGHYPLVISGTASNLTRETPSALDVWTGISVTAPNTLTSWRVTTKHNISFNHNLGAGHPVVIELSRDAGASWSVITNLTKTGGTTKTVNWTVTGPPTALAQIRVASAIDPLVYDVSDVNFSIVNPIITVTSPNTAVNWRIAEEHNITFTHNMGVGQVANIEISRDGGTNWATLGSMTTTSATSGSFPWVVDGPPSAQCRVRVSWASDSSVSDVSGANFRILSQITVTTPNTAVNWAAGTRRTINWSHTLGAESFVNVEASLDTGATWFPLASEVSNATAITGTFTVTMPTNITSDALIRVSPSLHPTFGDSSDVPFSLIEPALTVTAPNAAGSWRIGSIMRIRWSHNLGKAEKVKIELARDGLNYDETIAESASNSATTSGTFNWVVTGPPTGIARIRITWTGDASVSDTGNSKFKIY